MLHTIADIHKRIDQCLSADQHRLRSRLRKLSRPGTGTRQAKASNPSLKQLDENNDAHSRLLADIQGSADRRQQRQALKPRPRYPEELPVAARRSDIVAAIRKHRVVIVCGETGSGKTTQLPKMCLDAGRGVTGWIGHTQPRRIAARSVAARIASELESSVGEAVGYRIRFSDRVSDNTYIKLMTDGILLAEIQSDPFLNRYDTLIIDEAHERSLNIDFLLGYLKQLLKKRRDLKVIITSATIDPDRFARHFDDAPIILAEGRSYPVEVRWQPPDEQNTDNDTDELNDSITMACKELLDERVGDILVFLTGERDIREVGDYLSKHVRNDKKYRHVEILPLFSRLSNDEQNRIFQNHTQVRIVLATNVAETSLTVPGIRAVVDTGLARVSRYSARSKVQRLPIEKISRASADQRKGRCGREAPGVCIRLYDEDDFNVRPEFTEPEILRTNLASVILQMAARRLGKIEDFPFVESPAQRFINDGYKTLQELQALDARRGLTSMGKKLARMPVDPRLARMIIAAAEEGCVREVLIVVAALSVQDPRDRPQDKREAADELHAEFRHEKSDFLTWVNLWEFVQVQRDRLSNSQFRKMCRQRFLSWPRLREWNDVHQQLREVCKQMSLPIQQKQQTDYDRIHRALLTGLLSNVAVHTEKHDYLATRNRRVSIFPGSGLFKSKHKWIMAAEISETTRLYLREVAEINVEWIEREAEHLLQYSYRDPHWQRKLGIVSAWRQSTLYGLIINPKKRVAYAPHDAVQARRILIQEGLVAGQMITRGQFLQHNLALVEEIGILEHKSRRRDILVDQATMEHFYDELVPEDVVSSETFERFRKEAERGNPRALYFDREQLILDEPDESTVEAFPDHMEFGGMSLPLKYHFSPGDDDDGVTLIVPVEVINRVDVDQCEWLVPGLQAEKVSALIKSLPKSLRRNFVPAPDYAASFVAEAGKGEVDRNQSLRSALSRWLFRQGGIEVETADFDTSVLLDYLHMRFEIVTGNGQVLGVGRNLRTLSQQFSDQVEASLLSFSETTVEQEQVTDWNFGDLPESVEIERGAVRLQGYPALQSDEGKVMVMLFPSLEQARVSMLTGVRALYQSVLKEEVRYLKRKLPNIDVLSLRFAPFGNKQQLIADVVDAAFDQAFVYANPFPRTRDEFQHLLAANRGDLVGIANTICESLDQILEQQRQVARKLEGSIPLSWIEAANDIKAQIADLLYVGFVTDCGVERLPRITVYLRAMQRRLDGIDQSPDKDRRRRTEFLPVWERFLLLPDAVTEDPDYRVEWRSVRWAFEELRVSLYAQELGTIGKVSVSRLENRVAALEKRLRNT